MRTDFPINRRRAIQVLTTGAAGAFTASLKAADAKPDSIDGELAKIIAKNGVPAIAAAATLEGKLVAQGVAGLRKAGAKEEVTLSDRWHIGSCTKSMTATLAGMLVEEKRIAWDTTIGESLKSARAHKDYKEVTLAELLSHRGGMPKSPPEDLWNELYHDRKPSPQRQRAKLARGILPEAPTGKRGQYEYSNAGYTIAGMMLEQAAGKDWESLIQERLFKPLKMADAGFGSPCSAKKLDAPWGHREAPIEPEPLGDNPPAIAPAGTVHCTIRDFAAFAILHAERSKLLKRETFDRLHRPYPDNSDSTYAFGWAVAKRGWAKGIVLNHNGSNTTFHSVMWISPDDRFAAVAICNSGLPAGIKAIDDAAGVMLQKYLKA